MTFRSLIAAAVVAACCCGAGAFECYEPFAYGEGAAVGDGGSGWAGNWTGMLSIAAPGFEHAGLDTSGNRFSESVATTGFYRSLPGTYDSGTVWLSWIARSSIFTNDYRYATLGLTATGAAKQYYGDLRIGKNHGRPHYWGLRDESNTANTVETSAPVDTQTLLVLRVDFNTNGDTETAYLWVNPALGSEPDTGAADAMLTNITDFAFNRIALRRSADLLMEFDEIRVGETWEQVTPAPLAQDIALDNPQPFSVVQRDTSGQATIAVAGQYAEPADYFEARAVPMSSYSGTATEWAYLADPDGEGHFAGELTLAAGWYELQVRAISGPEVTGEGAVRRVGVGDVFITCGQSNSANHGRGATAPLDERVCAWGPEGWQLAGDPQPIATGTEGSPWPSFGDAYAGVTDAPVGMISVGVGNTSVGEWLPGGDLYPRIADALAFVGPSGCKAILWHQGESDASGATTAQQYADRLATLIAQSRLDADFDVPWGVAIAAYGPNTPQQRIDEINAGQLLAIAADPLVFEGAHTDDLLDGYRIDGGVHFLIPGLVEHGHRWGQAVASYFAPLPGDYNGDGTVSGADYVVWADTFGNDGSPGKEDLRADGNGDGTVSGADYVVWANNFGTSRP